MEATTKRLYRAAERYPPRDREYRTPEAQGRKPRPNAPAQERISWDALSPWDTAEAAMRVALGSRSARYVVCFDIPENCGGTYEPCGEPGHFDIRGDMEELKRYLAGDKIGVARGEQR